MTEFSPKKLDTSRKSRNRDLIDRMRSGEPLTSFDSRSSWFPPRPTIEKDSADLAKVYGAELAPMSKAPQPILGPKIPIK